MADTQSKVRGFIVTEARKRRTTWMINGRPNQSRIASDLGVAQPTLSRLLRGNRNTVQSSKRTKPPKPYGLSPTLVLALQNYFGFATQYELFEAIEHSPSVPPIFIANKGKKRS